MDSHRDCSDRGDRASIAQWTTRCRACDRSEGSKSRPSAFYRVVYNRLAWSTALQCSRAAVRNSRAIVPALAPAQTPSMSCFAAKLPIGSSGDRDCVPRCMPGALGAGSVIQDIGLPFHLVRRRRAGDTMTFNHPATAKPGNASWLSSKHHWPGVPERWPAVEAV
jgi:hypothetical protein